MQKSTQQRSGAGSDLVKGLRKTLKLRILYKAQAHSQELQNQTLSNALTFNSKCEKALSKGVKKNNNPKLMFKIKTIHLTSRPTAVITK